MVNAEMAEINHKITGIRMYVQETEKVLVENFDSILIQSDEVYSTVVWSTCTQLDLIQIL